MVVVTRRIEKHGAVAHENAIGTLQGMISLHVHSV
jgi:hypothetical protein